MEEKFQNSSQGTSIPVRRVNIQPSDSFVAEMKQDQTASSSNAPASTPPSPTINPPTSPISDTPTPSQKRPDPSSIYPTPTDSAAATAPQASIAPKAASSIKPPGFFASTPTGLLVIISLSIIGSLAQLFVGADNPGDTQSSGILIFASVISIGLAVGLLFYSNICRILFIILSSLTLLSSMIGIFQLMDIQNNMSVHKTRFDNEIRSLKEKPNLTTKEEENIAKLEQQMAELDKTSGSTFAMAYSRVGFSLGYSGFVILYLLRPSIKDKFDA